MLMMAMALFAGCSKESKTTYTFIPDSKFSNELHRFAIEEGFALVEVHAVFSEYYQKQCVASYKMPHIYSYTKDKVYIANHKAEYVTVRIDFEFVDDGYDDNETHSLYIANAFYLEEGQNINIEFNENTMMSKTEPK